MPVSLILSVKWLFIIEALCITRGEVLSFRAGDTGSAMDVLVPACQYDPGAAGTDACLYEILPHDQVSVIYRLVHDMFADADNLAVFSRVFEIIVLG